MAVYCTNRRSISLATASLLAPGATFTKPSVTWPVSWFSVCRVVSGNIMVEFPNDTLVR